MKLYSYNNEKHAMSLHNRAVNITPRNRHLNHYQLTHLLLQFLSCSSFLHSFRYPFVVVMMMVVVVVAKAFVVVSEPADYEYDIPVLHFPITTVPALPITLHHLTDLPFVFSSYLVVV